MDRADHDPVGPEQPGLPPPAASAPDGAPSERELIARLGELRDEFAGWVAEGARLLGAESRLFASSLLLIVILAVTAGFVIAGALLFLVGAIVLSLIVHAGLDPALAALLASIALFGVAVGCFFGVRALKKHLQFNESRRLLARLSGTDGPDGAGGES